MRESVPTNNNNKHSDYDVTSKASRHIAFGPPGIRVTPKKKKRDILPINESTESEPTSVHKSVEPVVETNNKTVDWISF